MEKNIFKFLREKYYCYGIKKQIRLAIISLSLISTIIVGIVCFVIVKYIIINNYRDDFSYNMEVSDNIISMQINGIIESIREIAYDKDILVVLEEANINKSTLFTTAQTIELNRKFDPFISNDSYINEITIVDNHGKIYCTSINTPIIRYYEVDNILESEWIQDAENANGKEVIYSRNIVLGEELNNDFYVVKQIINPSGFNSLGYMVVGINKKLFQKAFGSANREYETLCFLIVDPTITKENEEPIVYFKGSSELEEEIKAQYQEQNIEYEKYIFSIVKNEITGWLLISGIDIKELTEKLSMIQVGIFILMGSIIIFGIIISRIISAGITGPLERLGKIIEEVGEGNRTIVDEFDSSEVGKIGNKFKIMVHNNLDLKEKLLSSLIKEREAELMLLQSQINPHFLYNTLDSLYCMAVMNEADDISNMVEALSKTFQLSLNKGDRLILVKNEIIHIESYMKVQNIRFNNRFDLHIEVETEILESYMLKFILQPFVENAMYHGLEPKIGRGKINILGKQMGDKVQFVISDDGVGMNDVSIVYNGYGVKNVIDRIHLFYGENYGVEFFSKLNKGTTVIITIAKFIQAEEIK